MREQALNEQEAADYLRQQHGLKLAKRTLTNLRVLGTGPIFRRVGRFVTYAPADLDAYAASRITGPMRSTRDAVKATNTAVGVAA